MKSRFHCQKGYTLIELMLVITIMSIIASILTPRFEILHQKAFQSRSKHNLGAIRSSLAIYYSDTEGRWPLANYPEGDSHYTSDGWALSNILVPKYLGKVPTPKLADRMNSFNGLSQSFDSAAEALMSMSPPKDVTIVWGPADYTPLLSSPYAYDNTTGACYIPNGNYDFNGDYFYQW